MQNYTQIGVIDYYSLYITYLSFQLLRNHQILQQMSYLFLYLKVLVKLELSMFRAAFHAVYNFETHWELKYQIIDP